MGRDLYAAKQIIVYRSEADSVGPTLHQLPPVQATFTGRNSELDRLEETLVTVRGGGSKDSKGVCLHGMAGVGKTALAIALAHRIKKTFSEAQIFVSLRGADPSRRQPVTPVQIVETVIRAFQPQAQLPDELDELVPIYRSVLSQAGRSLLLLDDASDANQILPLLPPDNCVLLVTSRQQFSLPGRPAHHLGILPPDKAQELIIRIAPRVGDAANEIATLCGNLPLALEVFAGAVNNKRLYAVPELISRLRSRVDKLNEVSAAFEISYELLSSTLQWRWKTLAVFPDTFALNAAAAVWTDSPTGPSGSAADDARDAMQDLFNGNLVEWNESTGRFRLHDLVREFCEAKLTDTERASSQLRYAEHFWRVGMQAGEAFHNGGENSFTGLRLFDLERVNIEATFGWLQSKADVDSASRVLGLIGAIYGILGLRFHPNELLRWLTTALKASRLVKDRDTEATILGGLGDTYRKLGNVDKSIELHLEAHEIARELHDRLGQAERLTSLGIAHLRLGEVQKAIKFHEEALVIDREIKDRSGEAADLQGLGNAYYDLGDARTAAELYIQTLAIERELDNRIGQATVLANLGRAYTSMGDYRTAIQFHQEALEIERQTGDRHGEAITLGNLAVARFQMRDVSEAIPLFQQAIVASQETGDPRNESNNMWNLALAFESIGQRAQAVSSAEAALEIYEAIGSPNTDTARRFLEQWRKP